MTSSPYTQTVVGCSVTTALPTLDIETYSEAGYIFDKTKERYIALFKNKPGIKSVGAAVYAEHPTTDVLMLSYDLKRGHGTRLWVQGSMPDPQDLLDHIEAGGLLESHNSLFEFLNWNEVCHERWGWPKIKLEQQRCSAAKAQAFGYPGALGKITDILDTNIKKGKEGDRLIRKFSIPRSPTKKDKRRRIHLIDDPNDAIKFCDYNIDDVRSEMEISDRIPDLSEHELEVWQTSQRINARGVKIDVKALKDLLYLHGEIKKKYIEELKTITGGAVDSIDKLDVIKEFLLTLGVEAKSLKKEAVEELLKRDGVHPTARRVLQLRQLLSMASIKKLYAIDRRRCSDDRMRDLLRYCGATATGRWAGSGPQLHNVKSSGVKVVQCKECGAYQQKQPGDCVKCGGPTKSIEWSNDVAEFALDLASNRDLPVFEQYFPSALEAISGCIRGLIVAEDGCELLCSDFSAIEAVCVAELAGEKWRQDVFRDHGKIYEMTASKITGVPFEEIISYPKHHDGAPHPKRKPLGKIPELASGYQGWIGAWKNFGAEDHFDSDWDIKQAILQWRADSPAIVEFWGGQWRKNPYKWEFTQEFYGAEGAAILAVLNPGQCYTYRKITYGVHDNILYCELPSGRKLTYHQPQLDTHYYDDKLGWTQILDGYSKKPIYRLSYMGWNSDSTKGPVGWMRINTYGGKLVENITQAVARDILAHALVQVEKAGYRVVLHVHDEIAVECPIGQGSVGDLSRIMCQLPEWCTNWPIRADGWSGFRYRKD